MKDYIECNLDVWLLVYHAVVVFSDVYLASYILDTYLTTGIWSFHCKENYEHNSCDIWIYLIADNMMYWIQFRNENIAKY